MNDKEKNPTRRYLYMLLSILVAIAMWIFVDELNQATVEKEFKDIPVVYLDPYDDLSERGLMLVQGEGSGTTETIDLTLSGRRTLMAWLDDSDISVTVDVSNFSRVGPQRGNIAINYSENKFTTGVKRNKASAVTVNIAELNRRTVDIRCELIGNVADGFSAGEVQLSHTEVELRGQAKDIDPVSYVKVAFDIGKDAEESITQELAFQYYDRNDKMLDSNGILPSVEVVTARLPVYVTKELPLVINYQEAPGARLSNTNRELTPGTVTVSGDASKLKNVKNIVLGDIDLLDLTDEDTVYESTFPIIIPDGCQNLSGVTRATLKISFKDLMKTELYAFDFTYENLPEGKTATILTEELIVGFFGKTEEIEALSSGDILVVADLSDYSSASGTYTVPATVRLTNGADLGVIGEYQVQARIREASLEEEPAD